MDRRSEIASRLDEIKSQLKSGVALIVVTKTFPASDVQILYDLGHREFGENRDVEGSAKSKELPADAVWHFQGGIQSNKLKSIVEWSDFIHSLDHVSHAKKISELARARNKKQRRLLVGQERFEGGSVEPWCLRGQVRWMPSERRRR